MIEEVSNKLTFLYWRKKMCALKQSIESNIIDAQNLLHWIKTSDSKHQFKLIWEIRITYSR